MEGLVLYEDKQLQDVCRSLYHCKSDVISVKLYGKTICFKLHIMRDELRDDIVIFINTMIFNEFGSSDLSSTDRWNTMFLQKVDENNRVCIEKLRGEEFRHKVSFRNPSGITYNDLSYAVNDLVKCAIKAIIDKGYFKKSKVMWEFRNTDLKDHEIDLYLPYFRTHICNTDRDKQYLLYKLRNQPQPSKRTTRF